jgi:hypothetical protein
MQNSPEFKTPKNEACHDTTHRTEKSNQPSAGTPQTNGPFRFLCPRIVRIKAIVKKNVDNH